MTTVLTDFYFQGCVGVGWHLYVVIHFFFSCPFQGVGSPFWSLEGSEMWSDAACLGRAWLKRDALKQVSFNVIGCAEVPVGCPWGPCQLWEDATDQASCLCSQKQATQLHILKNPKQSFIWPQTSRTWWLRSTNWQIPVGSCASGTFPLLWVDFTAGRSTVRHKPTGRQAWRGFPSSVQLGRVSQGLCAESHTCAPLHSVAHTFPRSCQTYRSVWIIPTCWWRPGA